MVTKFFPNQAADLEPVLALLHRLSAAVRPTNTAGLSRNHFIVDANPVLPSVRLPSCSCQSFVGHVY